MEVHVGQVTHYYTKLGVAAIEVESDNLKIGDVIHIKGHTTDLLQPVESMQLDHSDIEAANPGQDIGVKVREHVREHDEVLKVVQD